MCLAAFVWIKVVEPTINPIAILEGSTITAKIGPRLVRIPGKPADMRFAAFVWVEVVELTIDPMLILECGAVFSKVRLRSVRIPGKPARPHRAVSIKVIKLSIDPMLILECGAIFSKVISLSRDGLPTTSHIPAWVNPVFLSVRFLPFSATKIIQALCHFFLIAILPTFMVLRLTRVPFCHVIHNVGAKSPNELFITHGVINAGILIEPVCAIVVAIFNI